MSKRPYWRPRLERAERLIHSYRVRIILGFRFLYGLRPVTPFAPGMSKVPLRLFVPLNVIGALIWAVNFGCAGYLFGQAMEVFLGDLKRYEYWLFAALAVAGLAIWCVYQVWWQPTRARSQRKPEN